MDANTHIGIGSVPEGFLTPAAGCAETVHTVHGLQHARITVTNLVMHVINSVAEYANVPLFTFPDRNIVLMNAEANLTALKGNVATGINSADVLNFGIGTAVASNLTLATTMQNIVPVTQDAVDHLTALFQAARFAAIEATVPLSIAEDAANVVYLNASTAGGVMSVDDTITFNGTVDLYYFDLGNANS